MQRGVGWSTSGMESSKFLVNASRLLNMAHKHSQRGVEENNPRGFLNSAVGFSNSAIGFHTQIKLRSVSW